MSEEIAVANEDLTSTAIAKMFADGTIDQVTAFTQDPEEVARRIAAQRNEATSFESLLGGSQVVSGKAFKNKAFQIESVEWAPSDIEGEGLPFYAVIHAVTADGEAATVTCGAKNVVQVLAIADREGWYGIGEGKSWVKFVGVPLKSGYEALELKSAADIAPFGR